MSAVTKECPSCGPVAATPETQYIGVPGYGAHHADCPEVAHIVPLDRRLRTAFPESKTNWRCCAGSENTVHLLGTYTAAELRAIAQVLRSAEGPEDSSPRGRGG
jgi:hypothetical protein